MGQKAMSTTYLITGANRGIGRALVEAYLGQANNTVIAAVRNRSDPTSKSLTNIPRTPSSSLIVVQIRSTSEDDATNAVKELETAHGINSLDIVIANAGISKIFPRVEDAVTQDLLEHYHTNVIGNIILFRAVLPLLSKSSRTPKFITISSAAGSIGGQEQAPVPNAVYGPSKAALNWITEKIHLENENIVAFPVHPGWIQTEMGNNGARAFGMESAPDTLESNIPAVLRLIDKSTKESHSGKFASFDGTFVPW